MPDATILFAARGMPTIKNAFETYFYVPLAKAADFGGTTGGLTIKNPLGTTEVIDIINRILNYLIYISVPILALMILIGGFQILTARADPKKITDGKTTIAWAVVGFLVILISKGIALILLAIMRP